MRSVVFLVPGPIDTRTGGFIYDRRMAEGLRQQGWSVEVGELDGTFPFPTPAALSHAAGVLGAIPDDGIVVVDGLALGAMPEVVEREASRLRIVALVHLPLAADVSIDRDTAADLEAAERRALAGAALVIVTGAATLPMLARYELPYDRVIVVEPGTDRAPLARGSQGALLELLSVATLNAIKGHEILLRALADVPYRNWRLTCAGSLTRDPATVDRVRVMTHTLGLAERVLFAGDLDTATLSDCYGRADVFVLATLQETYGMAVAEALACGLPVVSTVTGAIPALVADDAGLLVPPGNSEALGAALARVIGDAGLRARLADGARRVRDLLPTWDDACGRMSAALAPLAGPLPPSTSLPPRQAPGDTEQSRRVGANGSRDAEPALRPGYCGGPALRTAKMDDAALRQWLALREPADTAARSQGLTRAVADAIGAHDPLRVVDLATGTGSNIRYLMDRLPGRRQHWLAVDHSSTLLAQLPIRMSPWAAARGYEVETDVAGCVIHGAQLECQVETLQLDLETLDAAQIFAHRHLVTASALLDLVSEEWLRSLATQCRASEAAALFTIAYNGRSSCSPPEPEDDLILNLFNRHQRTDKGLGGPAAGPDAAACAVRLFAEAGYRVQREPSDWTLGSGEVALQHQLVDGWADAAAEIEPDAAATIESWRGRRLRHVDAGRSRVVVGHDDVAAWLQG